MTEAGEVNDGWTSVGEMPASARPVSGAEFAGRAQIVAVETVEFTVRWSATVANVSPLDRVRHQGRVYDVRGVHEIGRREGLRIIAVRRAN